MGSVDHELLEELKSTIDAATSRAVEHLNRRIDEIDVTMQKASLDGPRRERVASKGPFLRLEEKAAPRFLERARSVPDDVGEIRFGALVAALANGKAVSALNDAEAKALSTLVPSAGGYLVPEAIGSIFVDAVRPKMRVLEAGALTHPMEAGIVHLPGWGDKVTAAWRSEGGAFTEAAPTFRAVTLQAKSVATKVTVDVEVLEDAAANIGGVAQIIDTEIGKALAEAVDYAALHGAGADGEPLGIYNTPSINSVSMATNGAIPTDWDKFLDTVYELEADNFEPTAAIWSPRTENTMRKLVTGITSDKTKLTPPARIQELTKLLTNQVPNTLTHGTDTASSAAFFAEWPYVVIGFRPEMTVRLQADPYTQAGNGQVVICAYMRADVGLLDRSAVSVLKGIKA